jgi:hypothetical protein
MYLVKKQTYDSEATDAPRFFLFSLRNLKRDVWRCASYEFEDVICEVDDVEFFAPQPHIDHTSNGFAQEFAYRFKRKIFLSPDSRKLQLDRNYDFLFFLCQNVWDLQQLNTIRGWREHFQSAVCWIDELWVSQLPDYKRYLSILSKFDHVIINFIGSLEVLQNSIPGQCHFIPAGADAIRFCPYPDPPSRYIDIFSLGRRSSIIHRYLLKMAEEQKIFYFYETFFDPQTIQPREHRLLIANLAKRSKYFWVGPAKFNKPWETCGQSEFGPRFFEGAASGCIMIGEIPECDVFGKYFDWPDVVMRIPSDPVDLSQMLAKLDRHSNKYEKARRNNIVQSLLRHDWIYRWKLILDILKLKPQNAFLSRKRRLQKLAEMVLESQK